jgi:uncharacterized protein (DUF2236 family)
MTEGDGRIVDGTGLEQALASLEAGIADPVAGLFGPASAIWRIDREASIFLGAVPALLLQLAHPFVAAGVAQHSRALADPIGRFHRTFDVMFTLVFGSADQAFAKARGLHRRHAAITGRLPDGSPYAANQVAALRWVLATLVMVALTVHERLEGPLAPDEREAYWLDCRRLGACFGLMPADLPDSWIGFEAYWWGMLDGKALEAGPAARDLARQILAGAGRPWLRMPRWYLALAGGLLPPALVAGFGLPGGADTRRQVRRSWSRLRHIVPRLPAALRFVAPYHEAQARLAGRPPGFVVRLLNRGWIGRARMG